MTNAANIVLLGDPVAQSKSPVFQNAGLRAIGSSWIYGVRQVDAAGVDAAIAEVREGRLVGANVTTPHKHAAFEGSDVRTKRAAITGAVNTLWRDAAGAVVGENTDVLGVRASLDALRSPGPVAILGAGGAASAAALAAAEAGRPVSLINRTLDRANALIGHLRANGVSGEFRAVAWTELEHEHERTWGVVINATSLGLATRDVARAAFDELRLGERGIVGWLDLSYSAEQSAFLEIAPGGARRLDGATMLLHQGAAAFERWTGTGAPIEVMRSALAAALGRSPASIG